MRRPDVRMDDARTARLATRRFTRDRRAWYGPQPSNFFETVRDQIGWLGPTIVTNLARMNLPTRVQKLAMLPTAAGGGPDAGRAFEGMPSSIRQRGEMGNAESRALPENWGDVQFSVLPEGDRTFPNSVPSRQGTAGLGAPKNGPVGAACLIEWLIDQSDKPQFSSSMVAVAKQRKPRFPDSGKLPTLGQIIRDARGDQQIIRRATRQALRAWFRQSEPLNIARREYRSRGPHRLRPTHGITGQTSAHHLVHLLSRLGNRVGLVSPDRRA
jgi:hypothetical protein